MFEVWDSLWEERSECVILFKLEFDLSEELLGHALGLVRDTNRVPIREE